MELIQGVTYHMERIDPQNITAHYKPDKPSYIIYFVDECTGAPTRAMYEEALLPEWVVYHMKLLDSAGSGVLVNGIGKKVGNIYWLGVRVI